MNVISLTDYNVFPSFKNSLFIPKINEQADIVSNLIRLQDDVQKLESIYQQKLTALAELKQSLLQKAFSGELTTDELPIKKEAAA